MDELVINTVSDNAEDIIHAQKTVGPSKLPWITSLITGLWWEV